MKRGSCASAVWKAASTTRPARNNDMLNRISGISVLPPDLYLWHGPSGFSQERLSWSGLRRLELEGHTVFLSLDFLGIQSWDFFQVLQLAEVAVLFPIADYGFGF